MEVTKARQVLERSPGFYSRYDLELVEERPFSIEVEGTPYLRAMRTPGEERFLAAGLCFTSGLVMEAGDISAIEFDEAQDPERIDVRLSPEGKRKAAGFLEEGLLPGLEGESLSPARPSGRAPGVPVSLALERLVGLSKHQELFRKTRASHAAMILDTAFCKLAVSEDVSRHNALDKAVGKVFLSGGIRHVLAAVCSSRIDRRLAAKSARAGLSVLLSISRPSASAVELADNMGMTLACLSRKRRLLIFCGEQRICEDSAFSTLPSS